MYSPYKSIQHKSKSENKFFLQQYEDEEELRISRGINEHMNNEIENTQQHYQCISNVNNNFNNEEEPKIEFNKLSAKNSFISGECYNSNYNIHHTKKASIHHSPLASPKSKKDMKLKARKLIHKQTTSSSVNNNTRTNTNINSTRGLCLSKDKINNNNNTNNKLSTKRNLNTSNKSAETHYKKASNPSDRNTLSSSLPLKTKAPFSAKTKKNKTHNNSTSNMTMLSYSSSNQGISRSTKNSSNNLPQSIELKKHIFNQQQQKHTQPHHNNISNIINSIDNNPDDCYDFYFPEEYSNQSKYSLIKTVTTSEGKTVNVYTNNKKEVIFPSGVRKEIYNNNHQIVYFTNGDLKQIFPNGKSVYYFKEAQTVQTSFEDGLQVFKFQGGQIEKHYPDGTKQITFPDGSMKYMMNDGYEEAHYNDGSVQIIDKEGTVIYELPDGTKEIKYANGKEEYIYPKDNFKNRKNN